ncbi:hypothetical protein GHT06_013338 [Daphnia sinensis]|uniref:Uncharacterized protein n=1 Tax=Daphnia sinensis TaxID=1820382 RepID=A0AAD5LHF9_9CRUS|nr:hypothetical protein GHT06_013338 [Daphnia sinensis]
MVQFVKPGELGTKAEFGKRFVKALEKGQAVESTPKDVRIVQRFDKNVIAPYEYVVSVRMSELQIRLYIYYLENHTKRGCIQSSGNQGGNAGLFSDLQQLARVWTHRKALLLACNRPESRSSTQSALSKTSKLVKEKRKKKNDDDDDYLMRTEEPIFGKYLDSSEWYVSQKIDVLKKRQSHTSRKFVP